nr:trehalose-phosphatase [uncultured Pseudomonas sp.]
MNEHFPSLQLDLARYAFFFDFDGTLAEIQPRPELVFISGTLHASLDKLAARCPVAVISGRPLSQLDQFLDPLQLPSAGVHGVERRTAQGEVRQLPIDQALFGRIEGELQAACAPYPELLLESKGVSFALHFRQAPQLAEVARALANDFVARYSHALALQPGKCVYELKPLGASKGEVIRHFMNEAPFSERLPVFLGDDLTDESGFAAVNAMGGLSIKVGEGQSVAQARLASVSDVGTWLAAVLEGKVMGQPNQRDNQGDSQ